MHIFDSYTSLITCIFLDERADCLIVYLHYFCRHFNTVDADIQRDTWTLLLKSKYCFILSDKEFDYSIAPIN